MRYPVHRLYRILQIIPERVNPYLIECVDLEDGEIFSDWHDENNAEDILNDDDVKPITLKQYKNELIKLKLKS